MSVQLEKKSRVSELGQWTAIFGVAAVVVPFTDGEWRAGQGGTDRTFGELQQLASDHMSTGVPAVYFGFAAYLALGVAALLALGATVPNRHRRLFAAAGVIVALAGAGVAYYAASQPITDVPDGIGYGAYLAMAGYALIALGCIVGVRRVGAPRAGQAPPL